MVQHSHVACSGMSQKFVENWVIDQCMELSKETGLDYAGQLQLDEEDGSVIGFYIYQFGNGEQ